ncbi:MAG: D-2-hydroxyacid dehydrogenase [Candidatus Eisenbacteria bacterium]|nr:D-2-hydroxyacid dehydrogenase [Candidatus Eisenbacteria bacterium]
MIIHARAFEYEALIRAEVRDDLPDLEIVAARDKNDLPSSIEDAEAILAWRIPKDIIRRATGLKWLASTGAGVDHLLLPELPLDVQITKAPPIFAEAISEYVMGYTLYVSLGMEKILFNARNRVWSVPEHFRLSGKLMGILGMGTIGTHVARAAKLFGMNVWGVRRTAERAGATPAQGTQAASGGADRILGRDELESFLPHLDFLVLTLPLTEETRGMIGKDEISLLKPTCWIINVSRGRIVDEDDLARVLGEGKLGGYVSDVFASEPLPEDSPLWRLPNVIITPHYAALTQPEEFVPHFADNLKRFARGEALLFRIDREKGY